ncbi:MAG: shikimate kinase [Acidobacteriota bacterium]
MARRLVGEHDITILPLDDIAWNPDVVRKPLEESLDLLHAFIRDHPQWIIEGCYADLVEAALPHCDELRFLNPGVDVCIEHCRARPWEPDKYPDRAAQDARLNALIDWVRQYEIRDDEFGFTRHRAVFDGFSGPKHEYRNVTDYA